MEIPKILYKYREWSKDYCERSPKDYSKRNLTEAEIYFASPEDFNDPFDCSIPFRYEESDLTPENVFLRTLFVTQQKHPELDNQTLHKYVYQSQVKDLLSDQHHVERKGEERRKHFIEDFTIFCLTTQRNNFLMWSHYADSHRGYSIGYNSQKLREQTEGHLQKVEYEIDFPKFRISSSNFEFFTAYAFTKSDVWEYEDEYRLLRKRSLGNIVKLSEDTVEEVIFGNKMRHETKLQLIDLIVKKYKHAKVFECKLHKSKFELTVEQVA